MQTFKEVVIKTCKEETVDLSFIRIYIFAFFFLNLTNTVFIYFFKKEIICLMIADCFCSCVNVLSYHF